MRSQQVLVADAIRLISDLEEGGPAAEGGEDTGENPEPIESLDP